jgi:hypothetical protein
MGPCDPTLPATAGLQRRGGAVEQASDSDGPAAYRKSRPAVYPAVDPLEPRKAKRVSPLQRLTR